MGLKYSYLRKRLKVNKWDYWTTYWELQGNSAYHFRKVSLQLSERLQMAINKLNSSIERSIMSVEEFRKLMIETEK